MSKVKDMFYNCLELLSSNFELSKVVVEGINQEIPCFFLIDEDGEDLLFRFHQIDFLPQDAEITGEIRDCWLNERCVFIITTLEEVRVVYVKKTGLLNLCHNASQNI